MTATPLLHLSWTSPSSMTIDVPANRSNMAGYDALTMRAALDDVSASADLTVTVVDGAGRTQSTTVSSLSGALDPLPGTGTTLLPKVWMQTVKWPVSQLKGVNTRDIRRIVLSTASPSGGVFLSDVAFQTFAVGRGGPSKLPQVSLADGRAAETDGTVAVTVQSSERSLRPVVVNVQVLAGAGGQVVDGAWQVVIPVGRVSAQVRIPVIDDSVVAPSVESVYKIFAVAPVNAVLSQNLAHLAIRDDESAGA
ncbi:hypothetical protein [Amycolatopsis sp. EV170708-02-1]|uniref:hypothetical protein n=1 Tax=Amycolatopsis sp. EV170708-02-1 TaxID=2919322 RepID=UPI001F0B8CA8|nr:hypothetical protein [Amycolatopsis sp. EV170708-02-1]UMP07027.1 hypothetical protein MJQ72_20405 [Amycolatopsis sp. EV170708-02-1]